MSTPLLPSFHSVKRASSKLELPVVRVQLIREAPASKTFISDHEDAARVLQDHIGQCDREHFVVLLLSIKNELLGVHIASIGTLNQCQVGMKEIFRAAILANAAGIIAGHNHPSGDPTPSGDDIETTKALVKCGKLLGIDVLDHIVVSPSGKYVSLCERGLVRMSE